MSGLFLYTHPRARSLSHSLSHSLLPRSRHLSDGGVNFAAAASLQEVRQALWKPTGVAQRLGKWDQVALLPSISSSGPRTERRGSWAGDGVVVVGGGVKEEGKCFHPLWREQLAQLSLKDF